MPDKPYQLVMKLVLPNPHGEILMLKRSMKSKNMSGKWELPGGKVKPGESFIDSLEREVFEETGLTMSVEDTLDAFQGETANETLVYLLMRGRVKSGTVRLSDEHSAFTWVSREELADLDVTDHHKEFCRRYSKSLESRRR